MQLRTVDSYLRAQLQGQRFMATLFGIFAAVALGIGVIGISDPAIFATIAAILIATGLIACVVPGSRARWIHSWH